ncbi:hypothetical protein R3P38DRAFT_2779670 [Favolaschia claudopus]|uniref:Uncharacterized protein n=1 Tax=Favolaschia claudopus TaxID=2862362 RepID=A0AAW0BE76_9AGAR
MSSGSYEVTYNLPLDNPHVVLPRLPEPHEGEDEPALYVSRPSTALERTNSQYLSSAPAPPMKPALQSITTTHTNVFNMEEADFRIVDPDNFRTEILDKMMPRTQLKYSTIRGSARCVASYIWHSNRSPDCSQVPVPDGWAAPQKDRSCLLLFLVWPGPQEGPKIWTLTLGQQWDAIQVGDEFVLTEEGELQRTSKGLGQYVVNLSESTTTPNVVKLIKPASQKKNQNGNGTDQA